MARWKACLCGTKMPSDWVNCGECVVTNAQRRIDPVRMQERDERLAWFHAAHEVNKGYQPQPTAGDKLEALTTVIKALSKGKGPVTRDGVTYIPAVNVPAKVAEARRKAAKAIPGAMAKLRETSHDYQL